MDSSTAAGMCWSFVPFLLHQVRNMFKENEESKRSVPFFCDDILINILSRLPAESVLQCRTVCKRWKLLTSTSHFIEMQFQMAKRLILLINKKPHYVGGKLVSDMFGTDEATRNIVVTPVCRYLTYLLNQKVSLPPEIVSSCHGLILYRVESSRNSHYFNYSICNPVTHEKITLPSKKKRHVCGFYFHPLTKEHRVLQYLQLDDRNHCNYTIYSLEKNSWRYLSCISHDLPSTINDKVVNGSLHWLAKESCDANKRLGRVGNLCANLILRFNINSETIDTIPHPEYQSCSVDHGNAYRMRLIEADEKLCFCYISMDPSPVINGWILEEDDNTKQWVKRYTMEVQGIFRDHSFSFRSHYNICILGIYNNVLLLYWQGYGLFSHDIRQDTVEKTEVDGNYGKSDLLEVSRIIVYKKSLVSLKHCLQVLKGNQVKGKEWEKKSSFLFFFSQEK